MIYAYIRVSTKEQNEARQLAALKEYVEQKGLELDFDRNVIMDKASGKSFDRQGYKLLRDMLLRPGDTLIVKELDRFGRNYNEIKEEWNKLISKGVDIIITDNEILNTSNKSDLEKTLITSIVFELLSYCAEKERVKINRRIREGIDVMPVKDGKKYSLKTGRPIGRPGIEFPKDWENAYNIWKKGERTAVDTFKSLGLSKSSFYNLVKRWEANV